MVQSLISDSGLDNAMRYWLLLELLCAEFKKNTTEFTFHKKQLKEALHIKFDKKLATFAQLLTNFSATFDQKSLNFYQTSENFWKIETSIILDLMGKDFKRTRQCSVSDTPKKKEERRKKKKENKNKNILSSEASTLCIDVIDYLNLVAGKSFRSGSSETMRVINARAVDGYSIEDFKSVVDKKCRAWVNDPRMAKFIRPQTLFGTKFESYLNEHEVAEKSRVQKTQDDLIELYKEFDNGN